MSAGYLRLCLVTDVQEQSFASYLLFLIRAVSGGISSVQLREKKLSKEDIYTFAQRLQSILKPLHIPLIINDYVDIVKTVDADGVHLGQSDMSVVDARKILGAEKIIGCSIETLEELESANQLSCLDYVAASAVFPSKTKTDCKTIWGLDGLKNFTSLSNHPVMAIGGINASNASSVIHSGADGIAVISAIHDNAKPTAAAAELRKIVDESYMKGNNTCTEHYMKQSVK